MHYKVYELDRLDKITNVRLIQAASDPEALRVAAQINRQISALEIWDRVRLIGRINKPISVCPESMV